MKSRPLLVVSAAVLAAGSLVTTAAHANPRPLPFTYTYPTLPKGEVEIEQFVDFTPVKALSTSTGEPTFYGGTMFTTEFEVGITDRLELGLYLTLVPHPGESYVSTPTLPSGNGLKQRLRYRFAEEGAWPIDTSIYGEVTENEREIEFEAKINLARRFGDLVLAANLSAEYELYFSGETELVVNPSAGMTYQVTPTFQPGLEYWMRAEYPINDAPETRGYNLGPHHYVGPAILLNFDRIWWSTGLYFRVSELGHSLLPGEAYGPVWARTVIGFGL